jgi:hypothetical protein
VTRTFYSAKTVTVHVLNVKKIEIYTALVLVQAAQRATGSLDSEAGALTGDPGGSLGETGEFTGTTIGAVLSVYMRVMSSMRRANWRHSRIITCFESMM